MQPMSKLILGLSPLPPHFLEMEDEERGGGLDEVLAEDDGLVAQHGPRRSARRVDAGPQLPQGQRSLARSLNELPGEGLKVEAVEVVVYHPPVVPAEDVHEVAVPGKNEKL